MIFGRKKKNADKKDSTGEVEVPNLEIKASGIGKEEAVGLMIAARQLPGYPLAITLVANAINSRADRILIDFSAQGAVARYRVDGIWESLPAMDRPTADALLVVWKKVLGLNPAERKARQDGKFATNFRDIDWVISFMSTGVPSGERVLFTIERKKPVLKTLADLGMRDAVQESYKGMLNGNKGLVIISAPATHGLPTTWRISLENADKFVKDWVLIENKKNQEPEIINVTEYFYEDGGDTPEQLFDKVRLKQPDVYVLPSLINPQVVEAVLGQIHKEQKHMVTRTVAVDAVDALLQVLKGNPKHAKALLGIAQGVLNQRLIRRLCESCKQAYQPSPQLLQKLNLPAGRVPKLYKPTIPPPPDQRVDAKGNPIEIEICKKCNGRGYFGRMALFELLVLDDKVRKAVAQFIEKPDELRKFLKASGHSGFFEEGILACALGQTSLEEVQRVMQGK
ncbi:MAG: ATPase, T2SS/T4P/T4SS family [Planctomycetota bacterium]|jgi:type II secretory ATPase GspE/PulE/Tfp pilus assembly ATPase PilB-like protein